MLQTAYQHQQLSLPLVAEFQVIEGCKMSSHKTGATTVCSTLFIGYHRFNVRPSLL
jgi:hypothetical protein